MTKSYIVGLDLGQTTDFTALAILERPTISKEKPCYSLPHLQRWPLGDAVHPDRLRRRGSGPQTADRRRSGCHGPDGCGPSCR